MTEWKEVRLGDYVDITSSKRIFANEYVAFGVPFYRGKEVIEKAKGNNISTELFISEERYTEINKKFGAPMAGDMLLTSVGTLGVPYVVLENERFYFKDGNLTWFRNFRNLHNKYLRYWLLSSTGKEEIKKITIGSTQQALTINALSGLKITLPPLHEQQAIADVLSALDDKIELNRQMNATLEAAARALFKSWFVDFDPVRAKMEGRAPDGLSADIAALFPDTLVDSPLGEIPKGWEIKEIGDIVETTGGGTPSTKDTSYWQDGTICWATPKDLSSINSYVLLDTERKITAKGLSKISSGLLPAGTVLLSSRAPIGYLVVSEIPVAINQGFIAMQSKGSAGTQYILQWTLENMEVIKGRANGSTFQEISKKSFRTIPALLPKKEILAEFERIASALHVRVVENMKQNKQLESIRDSLLPKLISGELSVGDADPLKEAV